MRKLNKNEVGVKLFGSSHRGSIMTSYDRLVELFGEPTSNGSSDGKVRVEWVIQFNGYCFSIYDWKEDKPLTEVKQFEIGGNSPSGYFIEELTKKVLYYV